MLAPRIVEGLQAARYGPSRPDSYLKAYAWAGSLQSPGSDSSK